jgi:hypothetical protein
MIIRAVAEWSAHALLAQDRGTARKGSGRAPADSMVIDALKRLRCAALAVFDGPADNPSRCLICYFPKLLRVACALGYTRKTPFALIATPPLDIGTLQKL